MMPSESRPRGAALRVAVFLLAVPAAACGDIAAGPEQQDAAACEGEWDGEPWTVVEDPTFVRGPYLQSVMGDQAVVVIRDAPGGPDACVDAACDSLTVEARGLDGTLIETTSITR
ncbi:MAG: hypothetical protein HY906_04190 [Deltaproteobacteria bacterium]|nr:hypothetical protein [Deltaproteobacteria bacterium]